MKFKKKLLVYKIMTYFIEGLKDVFEVVEMLFVFSNMNEKRYCKLFFTCYIYISGCRRSSSCRPWGLSYSRTACDLLYAWSFQWIQSKNFMSVYHSDNIIVCDKNILTNYGRPEGILAEFFFFLHNFLLARTNFYWRWPCVTINPQFQLEWVNDENKLIFNEIMMRSALY